jgi:acyl-CoA thioesterase FadM
MTIFTLTFPVDKNQTEGSRLTHIALVEIIQKARRAFLSLHKMSEDKIIPGIGLVIGELGVRYENAARAGERLKVSIGIGELSSSQKTCNFLYQIRTIPDNKLVALANTKVIFVNTATERATKIPDEFLSVIDDDEDKPHFRSSL